MKEQLKDTIFLASTPTYHAFGDTRIQALELLLAKLERYHGALASGMMSRATVRGLARHDPIYQYHLEDEETGFISFYGEDQ